MFRASCLDIGERAGTDAGEELDGDIDEVLGVFLCCGVTAQFGLLVCCERGGLW